MDCTKKLRNQKCSHCIMCGISFHFLHVPLTQSIVKLYFESHSCLLCWWWLHYVVRLEKFKKTVSTCEYKFIYTYFEHQFDCLLQYWALNVKRIIFLWENLFLFNEGMFGNKFLHKTRVFQNKLIVF